MILKIVLGKGGRGLLSYISQIQKAPIHHPQNEPEIYGRLHIPDPDFHPARRGQPTAGINQLQKLSIFHVVLNPGPNADDQRSGKGSGEVFLPGDALHHLGRGPATDADGLRRPGHRPGPTSTEKRGGRKLEKQSAPPTFSNFAGSTPKAIAAEFGALRKLTPNLGKAVAHLILSPGPEDRVLSKDEWKRALDLALAEHGAGDAQYAAYLHADTDHPHLHCFFSRITPAGQVISDSLSYQKNRSATKKITQELQLTPLPNPQAPGDRQALQNASRRAERRGTLDPSEVDTKAIHAALAEARDYAHFLQLLRETGNESALDRRGVERQIFGWRFRRIGAQEWVKGCRHDATGYRTWERTHGKQAAQLHAGRIPDRARVQVEGKHPPALQAVQSHDQSGFRNGPGAMKPWERHGSADAPGRATAKQSLLPVVDSAPVRTFKLTKTGLRGKSSAVPAGFIEGTAQEVCAAFARPIETDDKEAVPLFSPALLREDRPAGESASAEISLASMQLVALDFDAVTQLQVDTAVACLHASGFVFVMHASHSWMADKPRWRVMVFLSENAPLDRYAALWGGLGALVGTSGDARASTTSKPKPTDTKLAQFPSQPHQPRKEKSCKTQDRSPSICQTPNLHTLPCTKPLPSGIWPG